MQHKQYTLIASFILPSEIIGSVTYSGRWYPRVYLSHNLPHRAVTPKGSTLLDSLQFSSAQLLSHVRLFATPWISAHQASLSITNSRSSLRLTPIESVMPSSHLILCCPLLLLPSIPPSIRVFSNESTVHMRWPKYRSFSFSIIPSKEIPGLIFRMDWLDLLAVQGTLKSLLQLKCPEANNKKIRDTKGTFHAKMGMKWYGHNRSRRY